jgi:hypothetical protein
MARTAKSGRAKVGAGSCEPFGEMTDCPVVESRDPAGQHEIPRDGFSRKVYSSPCGVPEYQRLKTGLAGNGGDDCLPGTKGK